MQDGPKLIYNLATGKWLLKVEEDFWTFRSTSDALTIAGYLQINVIDKSTSEYLVVAKGFAAVVKNPDKSCQLSLTPVSIDEKPSEYVVYPQLVNFGILDCYRGFHTDLWVETDATIIVESIQTLGLRFYLPDNPDHKNKKLDFFIDEKKIASIDLQRGDPTEIWIDVTDPEAGPREIRLRCDYKEPNASDERNLGMIFVDYNVNLTEWKPAGSLL